MAIRISRLNESTHKWGANPSEDLNIDDSLLEELIELVGSEEEVEAAAEEAFNDLASSFEKGEIEMKEGDMPEKLAIAALIVKLVEMGKLGPEEADSFIASNLED